MAALGKAILTLATDASELDRGIDAAKQKAMDLSADFVRAGAGLTALGAPFALLVKQAIDTGDALDEMAERTGFSVEALSAIAPIARMSGTDLDAVERAAKGITNAFGDMENVSASSERALNNIGLTLQDIAGLSPDEQFFKIAEALAGTTDKTTQLDAAMGIFGSKVGTRIIPMLGQLAVGQAEVTESARALGAVWNQQAAAAAGLFNDALERMGAAITSIGRTFVESGVLQNLTDLINRVASAVVEFTRAHPVLTQVITTLGLLAAAFGPVLIVIGLVVGALGTIGAAITPVLVSLGLVTGAVSALGAGLLALTGGGAIIAAAAALTYFASTNETVRTTVASVWERIRGLFATALEGIRGVVTATANGLIQFWETWGDELSVIFRATWETVKFVFEVAWQTLESTVRLALGAIEGYIQVFTGIVTLDWETFVRGLGTIWSAIWTEIRGIVLVGVRVINEALADMVDFFAGKIEALNRLTRGVIPGLAGMAEAARGMADDLRATAASAEAMGRQVTDTARDTRRFKEEAEEAGEAVKRRMTPELVESSREMKKLQEETERVIQEFQNASRPADDLARKIEILTRAGHSNVDILSVMGEEIMAATQAQRAHGQSIPPVVAELAREAAALNAVKAAAEADKVAHQGLAALMRSTGDGSLFLQGRIHTLKLEMEATQAVVERLSLKTKDYGEELGLIDPALASVAERTGAVAEESETLASTISNQVSTALTDTARGLADAIVKWESFGETGLRIVQELATGIIQTLIEGALRRLASRLTDVIGMIPGLGGLFGSAGSAATGAAGSVAGSVAGGAGSIAGQVGGAAGSLAGAANPINMATGAISAAADVIGAIATIRLEGSLNSIASHTLRTENYLRDFYAWAQNDTPLFWDIRNAIMDDLLPSNWRQETHLDEIRMSVARLEEIGRTASERPAPQPVSLDFTINSLDPRSLPEIIRDDVLPEIVRAISLNSGGVRLELRSALGI